MVSHGFRSVGSDLNAYSLEATRTWHVQYGFSDCRSDIFLPDTKISFSQEDATKIKSKQFSEFGSRDNSTPTNQSLKKNTPVVDVQESLTKKKTKYF